MSDYSDLLFDPRHHTHKSCLQEVEGCDMLVVIVGKRFGGRAVPSALSAIDFEAIDKSLPLKDRENLSITQLEVLKAIEKSVPVFAFVDSGVLNDHHVYEKNKNKKIIGQIEFPNLEKQETAPYIFEFINFIRQRPTNNSIIAFGHLDGIREHLLKQWAALFQRLLNEQRYKAEEARRIDSLAHQIADIKAAVLASLPNNALKQTALGAINFRILVDFIVSAHVMEGDVREILRSDVSWEGLLQRLQIQDIIVEHSDSKELVFFRPVLVRTDGTYFKCRASALTIKSLPGKWENFRHLDTTTKDAVIEALLEYAESKSFGVLLYKDEQYRQSPNEGDQEKVE